jgi:membrane-bound lytic murein transglycosylase B
MKSKVRLDTQFDLEEFKELNKIVRHMGMPWNKCILIWGREWKENENEKKGE